jgi:hypothetical protein
MKTLIAFLCLFFSLNSVAQIINGNIYNESKMPLPNVNIYFDGTTIATISDANGRFTLDYNYKGNNLLVISCTGYRTVFLSDIDPKKDLNISMSFLANTLKEVVVYRKDKFTRKEKLELFRKLFLGKTSNASKTLIKNEDDINFKYDYKNHILTAFSDNPLVIINPSLGYKINYNLAKFEVEFDRLSIKSNYAIKSFYQGFSFFEETNNSNEILMNREKAFRGSQIHFFRDLSNNMLSKDKFLIYATTASSNNITISSTNMVNNSNNNTRPLNQKLCFRINNEDEDLIKVEILPQTTQDLSKKAFASFDIEYDKNERSTINFETNSFTIDRNGNNSNIENIIFNGKIAEKKVGDMLPLDYKSISGKLVQ